MRGDPIPELKRQLAAELVSTIAGWTPGQLIYRTTIDQPRLSDLRRGQLERISVTRLIRWLTDMDCVVELRVSPRRRVARGVHEPGARRGSGEARSGSG